jgi:hypothetical protein
MLTLPSICTSDVFLRISENTSPHEAVQFCESEHVQIYLSTQVGEGSRLTTIHSVCGQGN